MSFHKDTADIYKTPHINDVNLRKGYDERLLKDIPLNAPCEKCGHKDALPYKCTYCGGIFCGDHRLPEMHSCAALQIKTIVIPPGLNHL
jgi:predicted nucleic acid binding AN1-type Zn finger protein